MHRPRTVATINVVDPNKNDLCTDDIAAKQSSWYDAELRPLVQLPSKLSEFLDAKWEFPLSFHQSKQLSTEMRQESRLQMDGEGTSPIMSNACNRLADS